MGNSSSKDEAASQRRRPSSTPTSSHSTTTSAGLISAGASTTQTPAERLTTHIYAARAARATPGVTPLHRENLSFLASLAHHRPASPGPDVPERPRETKQEREARRAEKERVLRLKERERSMKEEGVDGGYLVTLGTYTGTEDFDKTIVRQLQIERRLAPFWKGLDAFEEGWTEAQIVAVVRGLPVPQADEVPSAGMLRSSSQQSDATLNTLTVPITSRSHSYASDASTSLSASHPVFSSSALLRGRAKTLASLATGGSRASSTEPPVPQELKLPKDPFVAGLPLEAYLYRSPLECPICFLYYPPHLNRTRCCDQVICSECFVQIKRPDPHAPEHHEQPGQPPSTEVEPPDTLVSEIASCPFCVTPEFGVSYDPPPFRRGLAYAGHANLRAAMSSSSSLHSSSVPVTRKRAESLSANAPTVVTTDRVRPDWAKKLSDARAHALRRSAAATALHNAAYVLGQSGPGAEGARLGGFGRRSRRPGLLFESVAGSSGPGTPGEGGSTVRRTRVEDLEDLMMMEAIRLSLAAEEERMRKEEKEAAREGKKRGKAARKEEKREEKVRRKRGGSGSGRVGLYATGSNESTGSWAATSSGGGTMVRSTSNLGSVAGAASVGGGSTTPVIPEGFEGRVEGKGKAPISQQAYGSNDPQRHLEVSRATLLPSSAAGAIAVPASSSGGGHSRQFSHDSSAASSFEGPDSASGSLRAADEHHHVTGGLLIEGEDGSEQATPLPGSTPTTEPMFNFRSLAAMIDHEDGKVDHDEHIEHSAPLVPTTTTTRSRGDSGASYPQQSHPVLLDTSAGRSRGDSGASGTQHHSVLLDTSAGRSRGDSGESRSSGAPPPIYVERASIGGPGDEDAITRAPEARLVHPVDEKEVGGGGQMFARARVAEGTK